MGQQQTSQQGTSTQEMAPSLATMIPGLVSVDHREALLQKRGAQSATGRLPSTDKEFSQRGLPYAKGGEAPREFKDNEGNVRVGRPDIQDSCSDFIFGWWNLTDLEEDELGSTYGLVEMREGNPAAKYVPEEYFNTSTPQRCFKAGRYLCFRPTEAMKRRGNKAREACVGRLLASVAPKGKREEGFATLEVKEGSN